MFNVIQYVFFRRKSEALGPHNLFSLIGERLMLNESTITMPIYNVLFEVASDPWLYRDLETFLINIYL